MNYSIDEIPQIGEGTYRVSKSDIASVLKHSIAEGYKHIDCAFLYNNQKVIGNFLNSEDYKDIRSKLWITSKVDLFSIADNKVENCISQIFTDLNTHYIDLLLLHAPSEHKNNLNAWMVLDQLKKQGKVRYIGVSNYKEEHLKSLIQESKIVPYTNQIEVTPFCTREKLVKYCVDHDILVSAHTPLTKGNKLSNEVLTEIAKKYEVTPAQVMIQWSKQKGYIVLPRSKDPSHIKENINIKFTISDEDMAKLDKLDENYVTHPKYL